jgi:hypothetical protein
VLHPYARITPVISLKPLYSEKHRSALITTLLGLLGLALIIIAFVAAGVSSLGVRDLWGDSAFALVIGLVLAGSHWFFVPREYKVYSEHLVVTYGRPRTLPVPYGNIVSVDVLIHPFGTELRIRRSRGRNLHLQPLNPKQFHQSLEDALSKSGGAPKNPIPSSEQFPPTNFKG